MKNFDLKKYLAENKLLKEDTTTYKPGTYRVLEYDTDDYSINGDFFELTRKATLDEIQAVVGKAMGKPESAYWTIELGRDIVELPKIYKL